VEEGFLGFEKEGVIGVELDEETIKVEKAKKPRASRRTQNNSAAASWDGRSRGTMQR
jgi:hypothetical protein